MERLDDLIIGDLSIWQREDQFCFSIDAILLAHFVKIKERWKYADLGCGTGVISLVLTALGAKEIVGFEINEVTAELATKSVEYNMLCDKITIEKIDYRKAYKQYSGKFNAIVVNPPYFNQNAGKRAVNDGVQLALHDEETTLEDIALSAKRLLRFGGIIYMIYTTPRLAYALEALRAEGLEPKRIRFVHSQLESPSKLVLIEAKMGAKPGLIVEAPLLIYDEPNVYNEEVAKWYQRKG